MNNRFRKWLKKKLDIKKGETGKSPLLLANTSDIDYISARFNKQYLSSPGGVQVTDLCNKIILMIDQIRKAHNGR